VRRTAKRYRMIVTTGNVAAAAANGRLLAVMTLS